MENNQLLPFERNRYYVGKLLTSADFQAEQAYGLQKRRFMNEAMFGAGIICGLSVFSLDDQSVMIDSGVALDGWGHEIVLESAAVRKLSAVEGFETLESNRAMLCLRYYEEDVHPVYALHGQDGGEGYECNRIREGFAFFLRDVDKLPPKVEPESEFLSTTLLYEDGDYSIHLAAPTVAACGHRLRVDVMVKGLAFSALPLSVDMLLQTPAFFGDEGERSLHILMQDINLLPGQELKRSFWLSAQNTPAPDSVLIAGAESTRITMGDRRVNLVDSFMMRVSVEKATPEELIARAIGRISLETREMAGRADFVPLAEISLQRTKTAYLIEEIREDSVKTFVQTTAAAHLRSEYGAYYADWEQRKGDNAATVASVSEEFGPRYQEPMYASGLCEIPTGGARRGQLIYSDEILHGLGRGNVAVQIGFEYLADDPRLGTQGRNTIFGAAELFADEHPPITQAETAVKVLNDRGSFIVAARLGQDAVQAVLLLRWVAIKLPVGDENSKLQRLAGKSIAAEQPTVVIATRESYYFNVKFKNMEPCTLSYELTEPDSGDITVDGIYTAPGKEGVYEIRISCADLPLVSTYAYAVVKKRSAEQEEEAAPQR